MAKRKVKEIFPTMKANGNDANDNELSFVECQAEIVEINDVKTIHGDKIVCVLKNIDSETFQVFINNFSMEKLISALGDDDDKWIGKLVDLKKELDEDHDQDMIVIYPIK